MLDQFFRKYAIDPSDTLVVACSGGSDSMYLLSEILEVHPRGRVVVAHFNHRLRGAESDSEEAFVREYCASNELRFESGSSDISADAEEMKLGIEETARIKRYGFLETVREKYGAEYVMTAHHLDDSIETLVFNLVR